MDNGRRIIEWEGSDDDEDDDDDGEVLNASDHARLIAPSSFSLSILSFFFLLSLISSRDIYRWEMMMSDIIIPLLCRFIRIREYKFNSATADAFDALQSSPSRFMDCKRFATRHLIFSNGVRESEKKRQKRMEKDGKLWLWRLQLHYVGKMGRMSCQERKKWEPGSGWWSIAFRLLYFLFYFILYDANVFPSWYTAIYFDI